MQKFADTVATDFWVKAVARFGSAVGELPIIKMNKRLTSTAGRAFIEHGYIDLSCFLLERNAEYYKIDTIPHELCHMIAFRLYKDEGHGKGWKYVMQELGVNGKRCHSMKTKREVERESAPRARITSEV